jgi:uncharacterized protein (DUF1015 family)
MCSDLVESCKKIINVAEKINDTQYEIVNTLERMSLKKENKLACTYLLGQIRQQQMSINGVRDILKELL